MTLYAYVMTHDTGGSPNPSRGVCTLAYCMEMTRGVAREGDYVVGLAGADFRESRWNIIYAMRVSEWLSPNAYCSRFPAREPEDEEQRTTLRFGALVSDDFVYWGREAPSLAEAQLQFLQDAFPNSSRGHRFNFTKPEVQKFISWFNRQEKGKQGEPFGLKGKHPSHRKC